MSSRATKERNALIASSAVHELIEKTSKRMLAALERDFVRLSAVAIESGTLFSQPIEIEYTPPTHGFDPGPDRFDFVASLDDCKKGQPGVIQCGCDACMPKTSPQTKPHDGMPRCSRCKQPYPYSDKWHFVCASCKSYSDL